MSNHFQSCCFSVHVLVIYGKQNKKKKNQTKFCCSLLSHTEYWTYLTKYYSCRISIGRSRTPPIRTPQLGVHIRPSGSNSGSTDSIGKLVWTRASLWLLQSQCQPVCIMYWSAVSVLLEYWLCTIIHCFFQSAMKFLPPFTFSGWCGTPTPQEIPNPLLFLTISSVQCKTPFARRASSCCQPHHALYSFASFYPSDFYFLLNCLITEKHQRQKENIKQKGRTSFFLSGPLSFQEVWNKRALLSPTARACFSVNALLLSLALKPTSDTN